jgi:2-polyprenyl-6-methoxyphenol hydroxylase-like FAD-dependent oxidoreductase
MLSVMETEVIVVGAGPTGLVLACELAMRGVAVEVVERQAAPSGQSRGGGVNARTAEVLAMRGLLDAATAKAVPREASGGHFAALPVALDMRPWRTRNAGLMIPQDRLEEILEQRLRELGVTVRRGTRLVGLAQGGSPGAGTGAGVTATVAGPAGEQVWESCHLVACDGGHSTVRRLMGVAFDGRAGTMAAVSADVELAAVSASVPRAVAHISSHTRTGGGYWMMLHPLGPAEDPTSVHRVIFGGPEQAALPREAPVTADEVARALVAVHGPETVLARLRWGTRFSDATRQVAAYRVGAVLFAGDAAHIHPPIGGQGLNLGVQDAMNLGWKLASHVRGGPAGLLDTYHAERHPVGARVIATVRAQGVLMNPAPEADDVLALRAIFIDMARLPDGNRYLAGLMSGLDIRYDLGPDGGTDPLAGARMPDLSLRTADGPTTVAALLRSGCGLLLEPSGSPAVPLPPGVTRVGAEILDSPIGTALGAGPGVDRVLVRPDGYVCWTGAGPDASPADALCRWFGTVPAEVPAGVPLSAV